MVKLIILTPLILISGLFSSVHSCDCAGWNDAKVKYDHSDYIFKGVPVEFSNPFQKENREISSAALVFIKFYCLESFKGNIGDTVIVATEFSEVSCGYPFKKCKEYLVFGVRKSYGGNNGPVIFGKDTVVTGLCIGNHSMGNKYAEKVVISIRKYMGMPIEKPGNKKNVISKAKEICYNFDNRTKPSTFFGKWAKIDTVQYVLQFEFDKTMFVSTGHSKTNTPMVHSKGDWFVDGEFMYLPSIGRNPRYGKYSPIRYKFKNKQCLSIFRGGGWNDYQKVK